jgi:hypothetical protein
MLLLLSDGNDVGPGGWRLRDGFVGPGPQKGGQPDAER